MNEEGGLALILISLLNARWIVSTQYIISLDRFISDSLEIHITLSIIRLTL